MDIDYLVIGAGFSGAVLAERIASVLGKRVLMVEQRTHIGGNAYDAYDDFGNLVHMYGPHIFHTRLDHVWRYLSSFTEWIPYQHKVLGLIDGQLMPIPFNLNSLQLAFPSSLADRLEKKLISNFGYNVKVPILKLRSNADTDLNFLADYIYEKVFLNYTVKQWGLTPEELDPAVTSRVPVYISRDDRYFQDKFQAMPKYGYTKMFEKMLDNKSINVMLNTDYKDTLSVDFKTGYMELFGKPWYGKVIYTGAIDYFFNYIHGRLPYRSLSFAFENHSAVPYQDAGTVNYPCDYEFTRITEFKYLTKQNVGTTTIVKEYPNPYVPGTNLPYYPIKTDSNNEIYRRYHSETKRMKNVTFVGRLAEYQYYDMDAVVAKALKVFEQKIAP